MAFLEKLIKIIDKIFELLDPESPLNKYLDALGVPDDVKGALMAILMEQLVGGVSENLYQPQEGNSQTVKIAMKVVEKVGNTVSSASFSFVSQSKSDSRNIRTLAKAVKEMLNQLFNEDCSVKENINTMTTSITHSFKQVFQSKEEKVNWALQNAA